MTKTKLKKPQFTKGREGLMIPVLDDTDIWDDYTVLDFLESLQTANGFDVSTQHRGEKYDSRSYHNVLMLGKTATKPLVIIEGSYEAHSVSDIEYDLRRNRERQEWDRFATTMGSKKHAIRVSPTDIKESTPVLEIRSTLTTGGSSTSWSREPDLYVRGAYEQASNFMPDFTADSQRLGAIAYSDYLKQVMPDVISLLES